MNREFKIQALTLLNEQKISLRAFQCLLIDPVYFVYKDDSVLVGQLNPDSFLDRSGDELELSIEEYTDLIRLRTSGEGKFQCFKINNMTIPFLQ